MTLVEACALSYLEDHRSHIVAISDAIWNYAEPAFREKKSASLLVRGLSDEGFEVAPGSAGLPTAFLATWGEGYPTVGFIGEYDAVPGVSQKVRPEMDPLAPGAYGHGCGHNLLGAGALGAAVAVKRAMQKCGLRGTVKYFGCPAEESGAAKVYMVRAGSFADTDVILGWHPAAANHVVRASTLSVTDSRFKFMGQESHAGINPHLGRSALDAAILMDVGVNYLREHVMPNVRIHSTITDGGGLPNVVPATAEIHYLVRAPQRQDVGATHSRLVDIARGAALMAGVTMQERFMSACSNAMSSRVLSQVMDEALLEVGNPGFDSEDYEFARQISRGISKEDRCNSIAMFGIPMSVADDVLHNQVCPADDYSIVLPISGDSSDVSWLVPMGRMFAACQPIGVANHSWQQVACSGHSIGHKGMMLASRTLALAAVKLLENPSLVDRAKEELRVTTAASPYVSPIPGDVLFPPQMTREVP